MSAGKEPADRPKISRLPAPTLFVGPPSRNASNISLQPPPKDTSRPLERQRSHVGREESRTDRSGSPSGPNDSLAVGGASRRQGSQGYMATAVKSEQQPPLQSNERTDALWTEMQITLQEVELSASSGAHVFGTDHSKALEELRTAQIALAQAWAKSEADDGPTSSSSKDTKTSGRSVHPADSLTAERRAKVGGDGKMSMEEDTENDIALARRRREANDAYFEKVNRGVLEVVSRLEEVAKKMKGVETESKEIWGDDGSVESVA